MDRQIKAEPGAGDTPSANSATASPLPTSANYTDFILRSTAPSTSSGWKHNVMKFAVSGERVIDPTDESLFMRPVKLNRKDPRTVRRLTDEDRERHNKRALARAAKAAGTSMDVDVKPGEGVKAEDQEGEGDEDKEELNPELVGKGANGTTGMQRRGPSGQFKKKTKRVYVSSEEARRLRREEWQPWVLEDDEGQERWIGRLEGGAGEVEAKSAQTDSKNGAGLSGWRPAAEASATGGGGSAYVAFVLSEDGEHFEVVPVNRWYRFNQGPKYMTLAEEEAEQEYNRQQKSKETERWMMHRRAAPASGSSTPQPSASTSGSNGTGSGGAVSASALRARMMARSATGTRADSSDIDERGRPRVRTVISAGGEGGRGGGGARGGRAQDQDADEFDYEEDFQDDEEGIAQIDDLADDDERKELEERIRREMRAVERMEDTPEAEDDDEVTKRLTGTGKEIKKLVKKSDKSGAYESDDEDENPYASDEIDSDDNASTTSAPRNDSTSRAASPNPASPSSAARSRNASHSRAGSPAGSGSALVAKRATSPAPGSSSSGSGKRKRSAHSADGAASDSDAGGDPSKRRKAHGKSPSPAPTALITQADLIAYLKTKPNQTSTTKEVLTHFRKAIKGDSRNKASIGGLLQAVANLVGGNLVLKQGL
ncbi:transcription factor IIF subunit tfg1 [Rhodotorula toruloides]